MAERKDRTVPGGLYLVEGQLVNANGQPVAGWTIVDGQAMSAEELQQPGGSPQAPQSGTTTKESSKKGKGKSQEPGQPPAGKEGENA